MRLSVLVLLACIGVGLSRSTLHPALDFYQRGESGSLIEAPYSPLFVQSKAQFFTGSPRNCYPCTKEPYYVRTLIYNNRPEGFTILPYNSPFEGHYGNFFTVFDSEGSNTATYVGPTSTHIFPPPSDILDKCLMDLPAAVPGDQPKAASTPTEKFVFQIDIAKSYEFPKEKTLFRYSPDQPLYFYNRADGSWKLQRLWGPGSGIEPKYAADCVGATTAVKEVQDHMDVESCDSKETSLLMDAMARAKEIAQSTVGHLKDVTSNRQRSEEFMQWFGAEAIKRDHLDQIRSVYEKIANFQPSWLVCEDSQDHWLTGSSIPNKQELERKYKRYHDYELLLDGGIEDEVPFSENIEDQSGMADMRLYCTPGMTTWILPRDRSRTIHICPLFFTLNEKQRATTLIDTIVRFSEVRGAIDMVLGKQNALSLATNQPTNVCEQNASTYAYFAEIVDLGETITYG